MATKDFTAGLPAPALGAFLDEAAKLAPAVRGAQEVPGGVRVYSAAPLTPAEEQAIAGILAAWPARPAPQEWHHASFSAPRVGADEHDHLHARLRAAGMPAAQTELAAGILSVRSSGPLTAAEAAAVRAALDGWIPPAAFHPSPQAPAHKPQNARGVDQAVHEAIVREFLPETEMRRLGDALERVQEALLSANVPIQVPPEFSAYRGRVKQLRQAGADFKREHFPEG